MENFGFLVSSNFQVKSSMISNKRYSPIMVDDRFYRRYKRFSLQNVFDLCLKNSDISEKARNSLNWLYESRIDTNIKSSFVKTSIALELLLIFNESEFIASNLSERIAFLLSSSPNDRLSISKIIKRFYKARSGIVHGSKKQVKYLKEELLDAVDRLTVLVLLTIAINKKTWQNIESLKSWFENQKWSAPDDKLIHPYSKNFLTKTIDLNENIKID